MSRAFYDKTMREWRAAAEAVRQAGGDSITLPVLSLVLIFHGYEQLQKERAAALAWVESAHQSGRLDATEAARARHALGEIDDEQLADAIRAASSPEEQT